MLSEFAAERRLVEQVCYFDGILIDSEHVEAVATTLTFPKARLQAGQFKVLAEDMSQAGKHLRKFRLRRLAQVHTHPTNWVGHSNWDDDNAYSTLPGSVSIVLPEYARNLPSLSNAGVHLRTPDGWQELCSAEIGNALRIVPDHFDFRPQPKTPNEHLKPTRKRSWWNFASFWRN